MCLLSFAPAALAQDDTQLKAELDRIYDRLLVDPTDVALNRRMIDIAIKLKDYDAAIGAAERLIFYDPESAELKLEVARYYFEIGSYAGATGYLEDILKLQNVSDATRTAANDLIKQIETDTTPSIWGAVVQTGIRHQTNANIGPDQLGPDEPFPVLGPTEDWNSFAQGTLALSLPVGQHALEAAASAYYADQWKVNRLDLGFVEITGGPRFNTKDGGLSFKPYGIAQGFLLGDDPYEVAYGGGATLRVTLAEGWEVEPQIEYKERVYYDSDDYPTATGQTGNLLTITANGAGKFSEKLSFRTRGGYNRNDAREDYNSYEQYFGYLSARLDFDLGPWEGWSISPFASVSFTDYEGIAPPEAFALLDTIREDFQWNVGANLEVPLYESLSLGIQVQYTENKSNLSRYTYENRQVIVGPIARF